MYGKLGYSTLLRVAYWNCTCEVVRGSPLLLAPLAVALAGGGSVAAIQHLSSPTPPDSPFLRALGTTAALKAPPQTDTPAQRALEEWERTLCENKAVAILAEGQAGRPTIIHKDGGEMLIAIVLDRPLAEAKELVDDPAAFTREMTRILREKQTHPLIAQMMRPTQDVICLNFI